MFCYSSIESSELGGIIHAKLFGSKFHPFALLKLTNKYPSYCLFWPVIECFARCLLVEIIWCSKFLWKLQPIPPLLILQVLKRKNNTYKYLQYISEGGTSIFRLCLFRTNLLYEICILLHVYSIAVINDA